MEHKSQITRTESGNTDWGSGSRSRDFGIETGRAISAEGYPLYVSDYASELGRDFCGVKRTSGGISSDRKTASPATPTLRAPLMVQRSPLPDRSDPPTCPSCSTPVTVADSTGTETVTDSESTVPSRPEAGAQQNETEAPEASTGGLIVEDSVQQLEAGQMRKSDFLSQLRMEVDTTAATAMRGTGRTPENCPYLIFWFGYYSTQSSAHVERALHRYAPETRNATSVRQYMAIVNNRVRRAVNVWIRTGQVTGVPGGIPTQLPSGAGAVGAASANGGGNENGATTAGSLSAKVMAKARNGGARIPNDPRTIQKELGEGNPLSSGVRANMESAFGSNFSHVRIHTDAHAAGLSNRLNARAFTVGEHIAFGQGQYQPGTPVGDALIAHEVAHVVQQGGTSDFGPILKEENSCDSGNLETDADNAAVGALALLWGKNLGFISELSRDALPRMRSGLKLQRCTSEESDNQIQEASPGNEPGIPLETMVDSGPVEENPPDAVGRREVEASPDAGGSPDAQVPAVQLEVTNHRIEPNELDKASKIKAYFTINQIATGQWEIHNPGGLSIANPCFRKSNKNAIKEGERDCNREIKEKHLQDPGYYRSVLKIGEQVFTTDDEHSLLVKPKIFNYKVKPKIGITGFDQEVTVSFKIATPAKGISGVRWELVDESDQLVHTCDSGQNPLKGDMKCTWDGLSVRAIGRPGPLAVNDKIYSHLINRYDTVVYKSQKSFPITAEHQKLEKFGDKLNTKANRERMAGILKSELDIQVGNDAERIAVGWTMVNRMLRRNTTDLGAVSGSEYAAPHPNPGKAFLDLSEKILSGKISDTTSGATYFFSPRSMPSETQEGCCRGNDKTCDQEGLKGSNCGGGLQEVPEEVDDDNKPIKRYFPDFAIEDRRSPQPSGVRVMNVLLYRE